MEIITLFDYRDLFWENHFSRESLFSWGVVAGFPANGDNPREGPNETV
jgi:hypothetical protein